MRENTKYKKILLILGIVAVFALIVIISKNSVGRNIESREITSEQVGPIYRSDIRGPKFAVADIMRIIGAENLSEEPYPLGEDFTVDGLALFDGADKVQVLITEDLIQFYIGGSENGTSSWRIFDAIGIGSHIEEVEKLNNGPFELYGYEIDWPLAGSVASWLGGSLEGNIGMIFKLITPEEISTEVINGDVEYLEIVGDGVVRSNNRVLLKGGPVVEGIFVNWVF